MSGVRKFVPKAAQEQVENAIEREVEALPEGAQKVLEHFGAEKTHVSEESAEPFPWETDEEYAERQMRLVEDPFGKLSYTELSEKLLAEYAEAEREFKRWQEIREALRGEILRLVGQERGTLQRGRYVVKVQDRAPSVSFDWKQYIVDEVGEEALREVEQNLALVKEGKQDWTYAKLGKGSVVVDIAEVKGAAPAVGSGASPEAR